MEAEDSKDKFLHIPWAASLLNRTNTVVYVPGSRQLKSSGEDNLFAEVLKTSRTLRNVISFYSRPEKEEDKINEVSTLIDVGEGINGHADIMHGGIVASILDESMGILQSANLRRDHLNAVRKGLVEDRATPFLGTFTVELKVKYLKPVATPGCLLVKTRSLKKEGKKEWVYAEIQQWVSSQHDDGGETVVCATGEALFVEPRPKANKL